MALFYMHHFFIGTQECAVDTKEIINAGLEFDFYNNKTWKVCKDYGRWGWERQY